MTDDGFGPSQSLRDRFRSERSLGLTEYGANLPLLPALPELGGIPHQHPATDGAIHPDGELGVLNVAAHNGEHRVDLAVVALEQQHAVDGVGQACRGEKLGPGTCEPLGAIIAP